MLSRHPSGRRLPSAHRPTPFHPYWGPALPLPEVGGRLQAVVREAEEPELRQQRNVVGGAEAVVVEEEVRDAAHALQRVQLCKAHVVQPQARDAREGRGLFLRRLPQLLCREVPLRNAVQRQHRRWAAGAVRGHGASGGRF